MSAFLCEYVLDALLVRTLLYFSYLGDTDNLECVGIIEHLSCSATSGDCTVNCGGY